MENLVVFSNRLNLLKNILESGESCVFSLDSTGITAKKYLQGDDILITHYDGEVIKIVKQDSYYSADDYYINSSTGYILMMSYLLGAKDLDDLYCTLVGGESLNNNSPLIKAFLDGAVDLDFIEVDTGYLIYGDCEIGQDSDSFYLSLGGQRSIYSLDILGLVKLFESLVNFYPDLKDVLPISNIESNDFYEKERYTSDDVDFSISEDDLGSDDFELEIDTEDSLDNVSESLKRIVSNIGLVNPKSIEDSILRVISHIVIFSVAVKDIDDGVSFLLTKGIISLLGNTDSIIQVDSKCFDDGLVSSVKYILDRQSSLNMLEEHIKKLVRQFK